MVPGLQVYIDTNHGWLELPLTGTNFHGPSLFEPLKFYCCSKNRNIPDEIITLPEVRGGNRDNLGIIFLIAA